MVEGRSIAVKSNHLARRDMEQYVLWNLGDLPVALLPGYLGRVFFTFVLKSNFNIEKKKVPD